MRIVAARGAPRRRRAAMLGLQRRPWKPSRLFGFKTAEDVLRSSDDQVWMYYGRESEPARALFGQIACPCFYYRISKYGNAAAWHFHPGKNKAPGAFSGYRSRCTDPM